MARRSALGISIPIRYGQDELNDDNDPTGAIRHWRRIAAEEARYAENGYQGPRTN